MNEAMRWVAANVAAQALAAGLLFVQVVALGRAGVALPVGAHVALELGGGALEGLLLGLAQGWARWGRGPRARAWGLRTMAGFALVWLGGVLASYAEADATSLGARLLYAAVAGAGLGAVVGLAQRIGSRPLGAWAGYSALGWSAGLVLSAIAADQVPWGPHGLEAFLWTLLGMSAAGLVVGLVTLGGLATLPPHEAAHEAPHEA